jgi:hypothetical protein
MPWKRIAAVVLLAALASGCSVGKDTKAAEAGVSTFREQLSRGAFGEIYETAADDWKKAISREDSDAFLGAVNRKLGAVKSTAQTGWRDNATTGGHLVILVYHTKFENGDGDETFEFRLEDGHAVLSGYRINSMAMMVK